MVQKPPELDLYERLMSVGAPKPTAPTAGSAVERELKKADPDFSRPVTVRNLFTHHDTHPVVLDYVLLKAFGVDWFGWEIETTWAEIQRVFQTQISEHNRSKILAARAVHVSDGVWRHWQVFEKVMIAFNNNIPRFDIMQRPAVEQLYAGIDILNTMRKEEFDGEVKAYIAACIHEDDIFFVPDQLEFVQRLVSQPYVTCRDCKSVEDSVGHDGFCTVCTRKLDPEQGLTMEPMHEAKSAGVGRNLVEELRYDPAPAASRWSLFRDKPTKEFEFEETHADVQVAKLLVARDYTNVRRKQLAEQLNELRAFLEAP